MKKFWTTASEHSLARERKEARNAWTQTDRGTPETRDRGMQVGDIQAHGALYRMLHRSRTTDPAADLNFDPVISAIGDFGVWQFVTQLVLFVYNFPYVFQLVMAEYVERLFGEYWCSPPDRLAHIPRELWLNISGVRVPLRATNGGVVIDACKIMDMNYDTLDPYNASTWIYSGVDILCTHITYESTSSLVGEWNLACQWPTPRTLSESAFAVGGILGGVFNGYFIDRYGRRAYLLLSLSLSAVVSCLAASSPLLEVYLLFRCFSGFILIGSYPSLTILSMEMTGHRWVSVAGSAFMYSFPIGYVLSASIAQFTESWRFLHYGASFFSASLLVLYWLLPESPRWLWTRKRHRDLIRLINKALFTNDLPSCPGPITHILKTTGPMKRSDAELKVRVDDLYRTVRIRNITLKMIPLSFCTFLAYYGVLLRLNRLYHSSLYAAYLFSGIIEFTATSICLSMTARTFLKDSLIFFVSSILAGVLFMFVNSLDSTSTGVPYCLMGVRFLMAMVNTGLMTYVAQLYPTKIRGLALCLFNMASFVAFFLIAFFTDLEHLKTGIMTFLMGISGIVAGFLILLLPQPDDSEVIPDTIDQVEETV